MQSNASANAAFVFALANANAFEPSLVQMLEYMLYTERKKYILNVHNSAHKLLHFFTIYEKGSSNNYCPTLQKNDHYL